MRMRSKLFVPANRPDLITKALRTEADAICVDLEDAVPLEGKPAARVTMREFFRAETFAGKKPLLVRTNRFGSADFFLDVEAVAGLPLFAIALPKVESAAEVIGAVEALRTAGSSSSPQVGLLPTIESARGLNLAAAVANSSRHVIGLQLGFADLLESLAIAPDNLFARQQIRLQLRLAAAEAGVPCYDSAYANFSDEAGYRSQLATARSFGFAGASCIHPRQISIANEIFSPSEVETRTARQIVEAANDAASRGVAVFALDGKMIDNPFVERAKAILNEGE